MNAQVINRTARVHLTGSRRLDLGTPTGRRAEGARFPATIATENPVRRQDWDLGDYDEVLVCTPEAVNLARAPLPLIESHNGHVVNIGVVENIRAADGRLAGEVVLGASQRAVELAADIEAGIVTGLSVGYSIEQHSFDHDTSVLTATRWTPYETSIVAIPADPAAGFFRSKSMNIGTAPKGTPGAAGAGQPNPHDSRARNIISAVRSAELPDAYAVELIESGLSLSKARAKIIERMASRQSPPTNGTSPYGRGRDAGGFVEAAADALLLRHGFRLAKPHVAAADFRHTGLAEMAAMALSQRGERTLGMSRVQLIARALTTSDFPGLLANALNKSMRLGVENETASHRAWVKMGTVADFKPARRPILGSAPDLVAMQENEDYSLGAMLDDAATFTPVKYGRIIRLSFEAMVNDDLSAFLAIPRAFGAAAMRREADVVYDLLTQASLAGQTMQDGQPLFHTTHNNLIATAQAGITLTSLGLARALLRKQTTVGGSRMNLTPAFLLVGADRETEAEAVLAQTTRHVIAGNGEAQGAEWLRRLELVVEPRLGNNRFYLVASPAQIDTAEVATLESENGPIVEEFTTSENDARDYRCRYVFGARFLDWRGIAACTLS